MTKLGDMQECTWRLVHKSCIIEMAFSGTGIHKYVDFNSPAFSEATECTYHNQDEHGGNFREGKILPLLFLFQLSLRNKLT